MILGSLRARLLLAAGVSVSLALLAAGAGLTALFERHVTRHLEGQLDRVLGQILAHLEVGPAEEDASSQARGAADGAGPAIDAAPVPATRLRLDLEPADPRFELPLSGLYWQVQDATRQTLLRSRSLWDTLLPLPEDWLPDGALHRHRVPGPTDRPLLVLERGVILDAGGEPRPVRAAVALDAREIRAARRAFAADMLPYLVLLGAVLVAAAWVQVRVGLAPLDGLRRGVRAVRAGTLRRLPADRPAEVRPLVEEVNALLAAQEGAIERARAWTADLAHGLKTPLVLLAADAERLREQGHTAMADDLERLAQAMRRRVDRELIRARVRARLGSRTPGPASDLGMGQAVGDGTDLGGCAAPDSPIADLGTTLESLVRALARTPRGCALDWDLDCPAGLRVALAPEDLAELLGNLLENAAAWAGGAVRIRVRPGTAAVPAVEVAVGDDGPGVPEALTPELGRRGLRLDAAGEGAGLGLAIARDICDAYGAALDFARADLGGLAVTLQLPPAGEA